MYTVRKEFRFEAAHVLERCHSDECTFIHGHSYKLEVKVSHDKLNDDGMVIDFKRLKEIVSPLVNDWDHALIGTQYSLDPIFNNNVKKKIVDFNPTAENMCKFFFVRIKNELNNVNRWFSVTVRLWETATSYAEFSG